MGKDLEAGPDAKDLVNGHVVDRVSEFIYLDIVNNSDVNKDWTWYGILEFNVPLDTV